MNRQFFYFEQKFIFQCCSNSGNTLVLVLDPWEL